MIRRAPGLTGWVFLLAVGLAAVPARAAPFSWQAGSGSWTTPANWNPNGDPGSAFLSLDTVTFNNAGAITVTQSGGLRWMGGFSFNGAGTASIIGTGTFVLAGPISTTGPASIVPDIFAAGGAWTLGGALTLSGSLDGFGTINKTGSTVTLTNPGSGFGGTLAVGSGALAVSGSVAGATVTVASGATLTGTGTVGNTTISGGGNLTPGSGGAGTLTTGALTLADTSNLNFTLGTSATQVTVNGALALDGIVNITAGPGFGAGNYVLFDVTGTITNNFLRFPSPPPGFNIGYRITGTQVILNVTVRPLAASQVELDGVHDGRKSRILWMVEREPQTLGYRVWREHGGTRARIGPELIEGAALRATAELKNGHRYSVEDWDAPAGGTYWIESLGMDGETRWLGPVATRAGKGGASSPTTSALAASSGQSPALRGDVGAPARPLHPSSDAEDGIPTERDRQWEIASASAAKLEIRDPGVYRVTAEALFEAGIPVGAPVASLAVWTGGRPVAFRTSSADGVHLRAGDAIEFFGSGQDGRFTDLRAYWVTSGVGAGLALGTSSPGGTTEAGPSFPETLQVRERTHYFGALRNGGQPKYFGPLVYSVPLLRTFSTPALDLTSPMEATLEIRLQGATLGPHGVDVSLNGVRLGSIAGSDTESMRASFRIPAGLVVPGDNVVQLVASSQGDISFEVEQRLSYPRLYQRTGSALQLATPGGSIVRLHGSDPTALRVWDVTLPAVPVDLAISPDVNDATGSVLHVGGTGTRQLYAFTEVDLKTPVAVRRNTPSHWHDSDGADLVVIAHATLLSSVEGLVAQRRADGLRVALVDVEDVYDEFGGGEKDALAIRAFLAHALENWGRSPQSVLLVGSATNDPRNYLDRGGSDLIPTMLVETAYMETASDDALVNGREVQRSSALGVGRLPFSEPDDVAAATRKILARAAMSPAAWLLFVRDDDDGVSSFSAATRTVRSGLGDWSAHELARDGNNDDSLHAALIDALRSGPAAVTYLGHGEEDHWTGRILSTDDVGALAGAGRSSLFFAGTCLSGFFVDGAHENVAAALLATPGGGAWGIWASSGMTHPGEEAAFASRIWRGVLSEGLTLGEATLQAKSSVQDADVRATFHLFGDPSARMAPARVGTRLTRSWGTSSASGCGIPGDPAMAGTAFAVLPLVLLAMALMRRRSTGATARVHESVPGRRDG